MAEVIIRGPFFSPGAAAHVTRGVERIQRFVAREADRRVEVLHKAFFRRPTPFYWTMVHAIPRADYWVVTDGGIVYGPWLEGTGSRNRSTRFKGYKSFRLTTQSINNPKTIKVLTDPIVTEIVAELNGR